MSKRWFTSDWHLGMQTLLNRNVMHNDTRQFTNVNEMNQYIINSINSQVSKEDVIVHVGDLACFNSSLKIKPIEMLQQVNATVFNIHGNHDTTNKVKSLCESMRTRLGNKYTAVSVSHYPTYDKRAYGQFLEGDIHICGHVHKKWRHCLDLTNKCLNINVGIDCWNYKMLSDDDLIRYVNSLLLLDKNKLYKVEVLENGKVIHIL